MLSVNKAIQISRQIGYKPNSSHNLSFDALSGRYQWVIGMMVPDVNNPERLIKIAASCDFSMHSLKTEGDVIRQFKTLVETLETHELCEWITFRGKRIFNPHRSR